MEIDTFQKFAASRMGIWVTYLLSHYYTSLKKKGGNNQSTRISRFEILNMLFCFC